MVKSPNIFTIDPSVSFVDALAGGLILEAGNDPLALSRMTILLPNRRAQRSLQEAFLRKLGQRTSLLPAMRPIGDVDEDEIVFLGAGMGLDPSAIKPAISSTRRQVILMRQVMAWGGLDQALAPAQAWRLATELARFMDQIDTAGIPYEGLADLVPEDLAHHWDITLEFLHIVTNAWPEILEIEGVENPAVRRDKMLRMLALAWQKNPPAGKIIAAGSTGSIPATAELLSVVAHLDEGRVVLPGFDTGMTDSCWEQLDVTHPQAAMKNLIETMGASRHEVEQWHKDDTNEAYPRSQFLRTALLPPDLTSDWRNAPYKDMQDSILFAGLEAIVASTRREEADAIAVLMRETLETPGKTAALVTPDRQLARHVRASLTRWSIDIDDSGGDRALNTMPGRFLGLIAQAVSENLAPVPLLALMQHPLVSLGMARADYLEFIRRLDKFVLRGVRPAGGADGLLEHAAVVAAASQNAFDPEDTAILKQALDALLPLLEAFDGQACCQDILYAHIGAAESLATTPDQVGGSNLWQGEAGAALAEALSELVSESATLVKVALDGYAALFAEMLASVTVRPVWRRHPRLSIWGPLEARLQRTDVMILGGLNEGVWPGEIQSDPWMNRPMRASYGLPPLEQRIGQSAHDFLQAASGGTVYITRAEKSDGSPTVPSRWWFRLEALAGRPVPRAQKYCDWAVALSAAKRLPTIKPPEPKPPVSVRPKQLSVTQVETWMRDPYALYANKILGLKTLDPVDDRPSAATKGTLLHEALELFLMEGGPKYGDEGLARLINVGRRVFEPVLTQPTVYAFWWPRFEHIASWFVENEKRRAETYEVAAVERRAKATVPGTDFTLKAKADRIDRKHATGMLEVIDYKTGNVPTGKRVAAGFAPQLPLEAWLAEVGGFEDLAAAAVEDLIYWELKGGDPIQRQVKPVKDVPHTVAAALAGLQHLVAEFSKAGTPYLSNPRPTEAGYGDFDHLARVKEWRGGQNPFEVESPTSEADGPKKGGENG